MQKDEKFSSLAMSQQNNASWRNRLQASPLKLSVLPRHLRPALRQQVGMTFRRPLQLFMNGKSPVESTRMRRYLRQRKSFRRTRSRSGLISIDHENHDTSIACRWD